MPTFRTAVIPLPHVTFQALSSIVATCRKATGSRKTSIDSKTGSAQNCYLTSDTSEYVDET